jgi:hypothetical protein
LLTITIDGFGNESVTKLSKIILPVHDKAQPQQSSTAENWLVRPEKNTDSACEAGPAFLRDIQNTRLASLVNGKFANFPENFIKAASGSRSRGYKHRQVTYDRLGCPTNGQPYARFQAARNCLDLATTS